MPLVSVCIPTYNGASYLEACLDSVLGQTFSDFEVVVVDDQSTDRSCEIAQAFAARDPRIRVICNKYNLGMVCNWNQCVLAARGEWIKFLFQDDIFEPNCIERMLAVSGPDTSMVVCRRNFIFDRGSEEIREEFLRYVGEHNLDRKFREGNVISARDFCMEAFDNLLENFVGEPTAVLLRRSLFNRYGFFNHHLIQYCDFEYWMRVGSHTGVIYIPEGLIKFRIHGEGGTARNEKMRKFRMGHIDRLICLYDFTFNPLYAALRLYASQHEPPINLNQYFASRIKSAFKVARRAAKERCNPDATLLEEMNEMALLFPGFRLVKKVPFSLQFSNYRWKMQKLFYKELNIKRWGIF